MNKFICGVCKYVRGGQDPPTKCPQCGADGEKFQKQED